MGRTLAPKQLEKATALLRKRSAAEAADEFGMPLWRARTLLAGVLVLTEAQRRLGVPLVVARAGLREGAAIELRSGRRSSGLAPRWKVALRVKSSPSTQNAPFLNLPPRSQGSSPCVHTAASCPLSSSSTSKTSWRRWAPRRSSSSSPSPRASAERLDRLDAAEVRARDDAVEGMVGERLDQLLRLTASSLVHRANAVVAEPDPSDDRPWHAGSGSGSDDAPQRVENRTVTGPGELVGGIVERSPAPVVDPVA